MSQTQQRHLPDGYESRESTGELCLVNDSKGIVITVHKRDEVERTLLGKYPFRVIGSKERVGFYDGCFDSRSHAEDKARELARRH